MKTAVVFQGGGPLGAFGCGAWQAVARWLRAEGHELVAVGGASIGALNAALVACHAGDTDLGAAAIDRLWRHDIATPLPGAGTCTGEMRAWLGWWQGLTLGNRALFRPIFTNWHPLAALRRAALPLYSQQPMRETFRGIVGDGYAGDEPGAPLLAVAATDLLDGRLQLFGSDEAPVDAQRLCASAAIALMFRPVEVGGRLYCDGEIHRQALVAPLLDRLRNSGRLQPGEPLLLVTIGQFARLADRLPRTSPELIDRSLHLLLQAKLADAPPAARLHLAIAREPEPHENISGQLDYTAPRIEALIASGHTAARRCIEEALADADGSVRLPATEESP